MAVERNPVIEVVVSVVIHRQQRPAAVINRRDRIECAAEELYINGQ